MKTYLPPRTYKQRFTAALWAQPQFVNNPNVHRQLAGYTKWGTTIQQNTIQEQALERTK